MKIGQIIKTKCRRSKQWETQKLANNQFKIYCNGRRVWPLVLSLAIKSSMLLQFVCDTDSHRWSYVLLHILFCFPFFLLQKKKKIHFYYHSIQLINNIFKWSVVFLYISTLQRRAMTF